MRASVRPRCRRLFAGRLGRVAPSHTQGGWREWRSTKSRMPNGRRSAGRQRDSSPCPPAGLPPARGRHPGLPRCRERRGVRGCARKEVRDDDHFARAARGCGGPGALVVAASRPRDVGGPGNHRHMAFGALRCRLRSGHREHGGRRRPHGRPVRGCSGTTRVPGHLGRREVRVQAGRATVVVSEDAPASAVAPPAGRSAEATGGLS